MARDVNRYESIIMDKLVALSDAHAATHDLEMLNRIEFATFVLLDCVSMFREPPSGTPVEDGYGTTEFVSSHSCRHVGQDMIESLLEDVSKGVVGYPRERVAGYLEDNHPIGEAVLLDVRDRLRKIVQEVDS